MSSFNRVALLMYFMVVFAACGKADTRNTASITPEPLSNQGVSLDSTLAKKDAWWPSLCARKGLLRSRDNDEMWLIQPKWVEIRPNKGQFGAKHEKVEQELRQGLRKLARL